MKYYVKQAVLPFLYLLFTAMTASCIMLIGDNLLWLKIILSVLNVGLYAMVIGMTSFKDGEQAVRVQVANDLERKIIVRTGENRPLKLKEEYKPYKGFLIGFISCVPLIVLLILHTIFYFATGYTGLGGISALIYLMFFVFFKLKNGDVSSTTGSEWYSFYGALIAVPVIMLITGVAYILGAKKTIRQQEMIKAKQREIYGEEN